MYTHIINIDIATVLKNVRRLANYTGDRMPGDATAYDRIGLEDVSNDLLEPMLDGAMSEVARSLKQYVSHITHSETEYDIVLMLPTNGNELAESIKVAMQRFLEYAVLGGWYDIANRPDSENVKAKGVAYLDRLKELAFFRPRPFRTKIEVTTDSPWEAIEIEGEES